MEKQTYIAITSFLTFCLIFACFLWAIIKPVPAKNENEVKIEVAIEEGAPRPYGVTGLSLPFNGEWYVTDGGLTPEQNVHLRDIGLYAIDFSMVMNNQYHQGQGLRNEDYYCFDKEIIAPCDGVVVFVCDDYQDNLPRAGYDLTDAKNSGGNTVMLPPKNNSAIAIVFGHLKHKSIAVQVGQSIKRGAVIGRCGNSGTGSETSHLHMHAEEKDKTLPMYFDHVLVYGQLIEKDVSPATHNRVQNAR